MVECEDVAAQLGHVVDRLFALWGIAEQVVKSDLDGSLAPLEQAVCDGIGGLQTQIETAQEAMRTEGAILPLSKGLVDRHTTLGYPVKVKTSGRFFERVGIPESDGAPESSGDSWELGEYRSRVDGRKTLLLCSKVSGEEYEEILRARSA